MITIIQNYEKMGRKKIGGKVVSVRVDPELWHEFRIYCVRHRLKAGEVIGEFIRQKLRGPKNG